MTKELEAFSKINPSLKSATIEPKAVDVTSKSKGSTAYPTRKK